MNAEEIKEKWLNIQKRSYTNWINEVLRPSGEVVNDIINDMGSGVLLCKLAMLLTLKKIRYRKNPKLLFQRQENIQKALNMIEQSGCKLIGIGASDIMTKNTKLILGLMWQLIQHFHVFQSIKNVKKLNRSMKEEQLMGTALGGDTDEIYDSSKMYKSQTPASIKKQILVDINKRTGMRGVTVENLTTDWRDGEALCALVDYNVKGIYDLHQDSDPVLRVAESMIAAYKFLGIPQLIEPEDFMSNLIDDQTMSMYLSCFMHEGIEEISVDLFELVSSPADGSGGKAGITRFGSIIGPGPGADTDDVLEFIQETEAKESDIMMKSVGKNLLRTVKHLPTHSLRDILAPPPRSGSTSSSEVDEGIGPDILADVSASLQSPTEAARAEGDDVIEKVSLEASLSPEEPTKEIIEEAAVDKEPEPPAVESETHRIDIDIEEPSLDADVTLEAEPPSLDIDNVEPVFEVSTEVELPSVDIYTPTLQAEVPAQDVEVPSAEVEVPPVEIEAPPVEVHALIETPTPEAEEPTRDIEAPVVDVAASSIVASALDNVALEAHPTEPEMPLLDIKTPPVEVESPTVEIEKSTVDIAASGIVTAALDAAIEISSVKSETHRIDIDIEKPSLDTDVTLEAAAPSVAIIDVVEPDVEVATEAELPSADIDKTTLQAEVPTPDVEVPSVEVEMPPVEIEAPAVEVLASIETPTPEAEVPTQDIEIHSAEVEVPPVEVEAASVEVPASNITTLLDAEMPIPDVEVPSAKVEMSHVDTEAQPVEVPALIVTPPPEAEMPIQNVEVYDTEFELPSADIEVPAPAVNVPVEAADDAEVDVESLPSIDLGFVLHGEYKSDGEMVIPTSADEPISVKDGKYSVDSAGSGDTGSEKRISVADSRHSSTTPKSKGSIVSGGDEISVASTDIKYALSALDSRVLAVMVNMDATNKSFEGAKDQFKKFIARSDVDYRSVSFLKCCQTMRHSLLAAEFNITIAGEHVMFDDVPPSKKKKGLKVGLKKNAKKKSDDDNIDALLAQLPKSASLKRESLTTTLSKKQLQRQKDLGNTAINLYTEVIQYYHNFKSLLVAAQNWTGSKLDHKYLELLESMQEEVVMSSMILTGQCTID